MDQLDLFEEKSIEACPDNNSRAELDHYNEEYCLKYLKTTGLWDMRAWRKHKDIKEVKVYVDEPTHKNNGHAGWCVKWLKHLGLSKAKIVQAIMDNPHIFYKNRLIPCMIEERNKCPRLKKAGSFENCDCWKCTNKQKQDLNGKKFDYIVFDEAEKKKGVKHEIAKRSKR